MSRGVMMRFIVFLFLVFAGHHSLAQPKIAFKYTHIVLDTIYDAKEQRDTFFTFQNTGNKPLQITCGTSWNYFSPEWNKEPIAPGKTGVVKLVFFRSCLDGRPGPFHGDIYVHRPDTSQSDGIMLSFVGYYCKGCTRPVRRTGK